MNMRIACITAGAGRMYCGSCLRDNALASALLAAGHDVLLIPTYTPTRTDEANVSMPRVFLGGINIYLQQHFALFRSSPHSLDRLWDFNPLLNLVTRLGISVNPTDLGSLTVSMLQGTKGFLKKEVLKLVRFLKELSPEVINLPNSLLTSLAPAIKAEMKVPVCCTLQGEDLFLGSLREPFRKESLQLIRENAAYVDAFIAVSHFGARSMAEYLDIHPDRIHVVPLGMSFDGFERGNATDAEPFTIGYLARIAPEKGLHFLCDAYRLLRSRSGLSPSRLWAAGYLDPEQNSYLSGIRTSMESWGLSDQFTYHGELDRRDKVNYLKSLSVLSVPETYDDPKGLFLLEALACGIPVVQPRRGASVEIVETTGGGLLVEPDKPEALADALLELWQDPQKRIALGNQGSRAVREHYNANRMAAAALAIYRSVI
jgi:glycosyltransferase involved in cell wall biosynthesis